MRGSRRRTVELLAGLVASLIAVSADCQQGPTRFTGPFAADSLAFFIAHDGGPLTVRLDVNRPETDPTGQGGVRFPHAVYWQMYDADEKLVTHEYHPFEAAETTWSFTAELANAPPGIYGARYTLSPGSGMTVDLDTEPPAAVGLMPRRCRLREGLKGQFGEAYLFVPDGHEELVLNTYAASITLRDADGEVAGSAEPGKRAEVAVDGGHVYTVEMAFDWANASVGISGVAPILCPSADLAKRIAGSVETTRDGRQLAHKYQVRMWEWMQSLTAEDLSVEPVDLVALESDWLKDPRNAGLLGQGGPFNHIARILQDQDLDPASGSYGLGTEAAWLGPAYVIDEPLNPYRGKREVLNRILLHEFAWFLALAENGTLDADDWNHYSGVDGLMDGPRFFQFGYVAPHIDGELRDLWLEGVSQLISRWPFDRVSCENQTSSRMWNLHMLELGSGDELYNTLARGFSKGFYDPDLSEFFVTGYHQERYGPDATYNGLCASNQAIYYRFSGDELAREGLRKTYDLFNHTVAPEPDGRVLGASNFSHRTSGSWVQRQWNAGVALMAEELPEAGVWYQDFDAAAQRQQALDAIKRGLSTSYDDAWYEQYYRWVDSYAYHPWTRFFTQYVFPKEGVAEGEWPVLASERFTKNVNDEFAFIRRPKYYAAIYTGATSHEWVRASVKPEPYYGNWEVIDGVLQPADANAKKLAWNPTQGLSMLWTPEFGSCVLGANWNVYTSQMLRADLADGKVSWPDYWGFEHEWDADAETLTLRQRMFDLPISVTRQLVFEEAGVRQTVDVAAEEPTPMERLVEQIPYVKKDGVVVLFAGADGWVEAEETKTSALWIGSESGEGVRFSFAAPVAVRKGVTSRSHGTDLGLIEVDLGAEDWVALSYVMEPMSRGDLD